MPVCLGCVRGGFLERLFDGAHALLQGGVYLFATGGRDWREVVLRNVEGVGFGDVDDGSGNDGDMRFETKYFAMIRARGFCPVRAIGIDLVGWYSAQEDSRRQCFPINPLFLSRAAPGLSARILFSTGSIRLERRWSILTS